MALLCREFNISRKTGYKIFDRYKECGLEGISDRTRRPHRYGNQLPVQVETAILTLKQDKPHWGARKIREKLPTGMVWSNACGTDAGVRRAPPYRWDTIPTNSGAPTTKASFCWAIRNIATR